MRNVKKQPSQNNKKKRITLSFTPRQYEELNQIAQKNNASISWAARAIIEEHLKRKAPLFTLES